MATKKEAKKKKEEGERESKQFSLVEFITKPALNLVNGLTAWMLGAAAHKAHKVTMAVKNADPDLADYDAPLPMLQHDEVPAITVE